MKAFSKIPGTAVVFSIFTVASFFFVVFSLSFLASLAFFAFSNLSSLVLADVLDRSVDELRKYLTSPCLVVECDGTKRFEAVVQ
jgi:hypothetical protein